MRGQASLARAPRPSRWTTLILALVLAGLSVALFVWLRPTTEEPPKPGLTREQAARDEGAAPEPLLRSPVLRGGRPRGQPDEGSAATRAAPSQGAHDVMIGWDGGWISGRSLDLEVWQTAGLPFTLHLTTRKPAGFSLAPGGSIAWVRLREPGTGALLGNLIRPFGSDTAPFRPARRLRLARGEPWVVRVVDDRGQPLQGARVEAKLNTGVPLGTLPLAKGESGSDGTVPLGVLPVGTEPGAIQLAVSSADGHAKRELPADLEARPQEIVVPRTGAIELSFRGSRAALDVIAGLEVVFLATPDIEGNAKVGIADDGSSQWIRSERDSESASFSIPVVPLGRAPAGVFRMDGVSAGPRVGHWLLVPSRFRLDVRADVEPGEVTRVTWHLRGLEQEGVLIRALDAHSSEQLEDAEFSVNYAPVVSEDGLTRCHLQVGDTVVAQASGHAPAGVTLKATPDGSVFELRLHRVRRVELRPGKKLASRLPKRLRIRLSLPKGVRAESWIGQEFIEVEPGEAGLIQFETRVLASMVLFTFSLPRGETITGSASTLGEESPIVVTLPDVEK